MKKEERLERYKEYMRGRNGIPASALDKLGYFDAPASTKHHGCKEGDLFEHSMAVTEELVCITEKLGLTWANPNSPYIIGMCHDLCKCDAYKWNTFTKEYEYSDKVIIPGHGDKSVIIAQKHLILTDEEIACIRWHMGAFERDPKMWEYYGNAVKKYPNILYVHTADMIASKVRGI